MKPMPRLLLLSCLALPFLSACHAGPRIERAAREVRAEQQAEQPVDPAPLRAQDPTTLPPDPTTTPPDPEGAPATRGS